MKAQGLQTFRFSKLFKNITARYETHGTGKWIEKGWLFFEAYLWVNPLCYFLFSLDFLKQTTYEVEAFLEAIQFFRQEKGHYGMWEMITGNEKEVTEYLPYFFSGFGYGSSEDSEGCKDSVEKMAFLKKNLVSRNTQDFKILLTDM